MKTLAIVGASGHGKVIAEMAELLGWKEVIFFDDAFPKVKSIGAWQVLGTTDDLVLNTDRYTFAIVAIGHNETRLKKSKYLMSQGFKLGMLVHPAATVSKYVTIDGGSVVMAGAVINPCVSVGMGSIINTSCSVDHDCVVGEGVHISPGAHVAGGVKIGDLSWLGIGSVIRQSLQIGCSVTIGAGAVVVNNIADNLIVKGIPAK